MKLFKLDVEIAGTVYVKAIDKTQAKRLAAQFITDQAFELEGSETSEQDFDSPFLPDISLSPVFTGKRVYPGSVEVAHDFAEDDEPVEQDGPPNSDNAVLSWLKPQ